MLQKTPTKISERFRAKLRAAVLEECKARGIPSFLDLAKNGTSRLEISDHVHDKYRGEHIVVLTAGGWAKYSHNFMSSLGFNGVRRDLSIVGGQGRQGVWAARVPSSCVRVSDALAFLKPAAVKLAELKGRKILRQGDVWLVQRKHRDIRDELEQLPSSHTWDAATRILTHEGHGELHVPFCFIVIPQRTLAFDGRRRRQGD
jgi:hypothetical protein